MSKENVRYNLKNTNIKVSKLKLKSGEGDRYRKEHFHKEAELFLVLSGTVSLLLGDEITELKSGQSAYIGMNAIHRIIPTDVDSEVLILQTPIGDGGGSEGLQISDEALGYFIHTRRTAPHALFLEDGNEMSELLHKIEREYSRSKKCYEIYIQGYLQIIVGFLGRKSVLSIFDAAESIPALKKVEPIAKYISEHYMERITLGVLSECVKYDKFYICKLMKTTLNTTFTEYLSYVRLQKAEKLLFSTDRPISEIVYETGFSTPQNFFKVFKSMYGYTPYKYKLLYNPNEIT